MYRKDTKQNNYKDSRHVIDITDKAYARAVYKYIHSSKCLSDSSCD